MWLALMLANLVAATAAFASGMWMVGATCVAGAAATLVVARADGTGRRS